MIRTIVIPQNENLQIKIPKSYVGKEIEVIAFENGEGNASKEQISLNKTFNAISIDTRNYKFNREEANER